MKNKMVEENVYIYKVTTEVDLSTGTPISTTVETSYPDAPLLVGNPPILMSLTLMLGENIGPLK